jgi:hypothetical protein
MDPSFVEAFDRESRRMARLTGVFLPTPVLLPGQTVAPGTAA